MPVLSKHIVFRTYMHSSSCGVAIRLLVEVHWGEVLAHVGGSRACHENNHLVTQIRFELPKLMTASPCAATTYTEFVGTCVLWTLIGRIESIAYTIMLFLQQLTTQASGCYTSFMSNTASPFRSLTKNIDRHSCANHIATLRPIRQRRFNTAFTYCSPCGGFTSPVLMEV